MPDADDVIILLDAIDADDQEEFLKCAAKAWFDDSFDSSDIMSPASRLAIGTHLPSHSFTRALLSLIENKVTQDTPLIEELKLSFPILGEIRSSDVLMDALISLISHARIGSIDNLRPFLSVQVQLWMRELRRLVAKVTDNKVEYALATDLNEQQAQRYLPVVNCRDCGETGWVSVANERGNVTIHDLSAFYNLYFKNDSKVVMMYPRTENKPRGMEDAFLCPSCLQLDLYEGEHRACLSCGAATVPIYIPVKQSDSKKRRGFPCPHCNSITGLSIVGIRSATAISASISQLFDSRFNDDKKTLAFSDNVQDAAHRAGFFNSRTWKSTLTVYVRAINELGRTPKYSRELFSHIVVGMLDLIRKNGAFNDKAFSTFTMNNGKDYFLSNDYEKWLPSIDLGG